MLIPSQAATAPDTAITSVQITLWLSSVRAKLSRSPRVWATRTVAKPERA